MRITVERAADEQLAVIADILLEAARWLESIGRPMWRIEGFEADELRADWANGDFFLPSSMASRPARSSFNCRTRNSGPMFPTASRSSCIVSRSAGVLRDGASRTR